MYRKFFKRIIDFTSALVGCIVLFPIFVLVTFFLAIANNGKPFFFQERPGRHEKIFRIVKFKTMNDAKGKNGELLPDSMRLTKVGAFVRKTSLDEIPQLFNVLIGDMSLIGPRPLRTYYLPLYSEAQQRRHEVRPGITGWAQVNGRNAISWTKKFEYDVEYVNKISLAFDIKILIRTISNVLRAKGINADGHVTTERFNGLN